jgi:hypothetical protein
MTPATGIGSTTITLNGHDITEQVGYQMLLKFDDPDCARALEHAAKSPAIFLIDDKSYICKRWDIESGGIRFYFVRVGK